MALAGWLAVFFPGSGPAAGPNYALHTWQTEDGLPQNTVTDIIQTRYGYLWVGTYAGLVRFDGARFTVFDRANAPALKNGRITSLFEDARGVLWMAMKPVI